MTKATQPLILAATALMLLIGASSARAEALMTGKMLALFCTSKEKIDQTSCQSYIAGIVDYHNLLRSLGTAPAVNYCLPKGITMDQIKQIVTRYIVTRTEHTDFIAAPAVAVSLYDIYPCDKTRR